MAPLRANLAACSVVAGSMSATCANTPASVADLQAVTGLSVVFCFFPLWMLNEAGAARHSGMTCALRTDVHHLEESDLQFYANTYGGSQTHAACDVKSSE